MTRRELLSFLGKLSVLSLVSVRSLWGKSSSARFVLIYDSRSSRSAFCERLVAAAGSFLIRRDPNWLENLRRLDIRQDFSHVRSLLKTYGPETTNLNLPLLLALPQDTESDVEYWNLGWLKARDASQGCYPISPNWWSVDGDFDPTLEKVLTHLYKSPNHTGGYFRLDWLEQLKFEELQSLHSDHHREMIEKGKVPWKLVNQLCPLESLEEIP